MPPPLAVLRGIDNTFTALTHVNDPFVSTRYRNSRDYLVDFLTPNRGSNEHQDKPAKMKALSGAGAQPIRHLDFLIHQTERSVLLHGGGVPVTVPRAERYAVHKLIVAVERIDQVKSGKDIQQAQVLIQVLAVKRPAELAAAWRTAWETGERWREKLDAGRQRLSVDAQGALASVIERKKPRRKA
jgi:hypothetical protein